MGEVASADAWSQALFFVLRTSFDLAMPALEDHLDRLKKRLQAICEREHLDFRIFEDQSLHLLVSPGWVGELKLLFPTWAKQGAPIDRRLMASLLKETSYWVVYYMDRASKVDFFDVFREYERVYWRKHAIFNSPGLRDKIIARVDSLVTGKKYEPKGQATAVENEILRETKEDFIRAIAIPEFYRIFRTGRLEEQRVAAVIAMLIKDWKMKNIFDADKK